MKFQNALIFALAVGFAYTKATKNELSDAEESDKEVQKKIEIPNLLEKTNSTTSEKIEKLLENNNSTQIPDKVNSTEILEKTNSTATEVQNKTEQIQIEIPKDKETNVKMEGEGKSENSDGEVSDAYDEKKNGDDKKSVNDLDTNTDADKKEEDNSKTNTVAAGAGIVAAAAASTAGIFIWIKRPKQEGNEIVHSQAMTV